MHDNNCTRCAGTIYTDTDKYGQHWSCWNCGAGGVLVVKLVPDLWTMAAAVEGPGGPRGSNIARPFGRVLPR